MIGEATQGRAQRDDKSIFEFYLTRYVSKNNDQGNKMATIIGTENDDVIESLGGDDIFTLLGGNDRFIDGDGNDDVDLGRGDDFVIAGLGADIYEGGLFDTFNVDTDTVSYRFSDARVIVNLETGEGRGGFAEGDTLSNIDDVYGFLILVMC